jgi:putative glycosyltransferase (TIGR04372 family)
MLVNKIFIKINNLNSHKYYYLSPHVYAIGNCAEEIYYGLIKARDSKKKLIILSPFDIPFLFKYKLTNSTLFSIESEYILKQNIFLHFLLKLLVTFVYLPMRLFSLAKRKIFGFGLRDCYNFPNIGVECLFIPGRDCRVSPCFDISFARIKGNWKNKFNYKFSLHHKNEVNDLILLKGLGILNNEKFVCLHVREGGFRNDSNRREYRNSDINNYLAAIKKLTDSGVYVVRMGDTTMTPLPKMNKVIDYPFTSYKTESMDITLIKYCYFYIGCQSGTFDVAKLYNKPILLINMYNWTFGGPFNSTDRGIIKHIFSNKSQKFLSIQEMFLHGWEVQNVNNIVTDYLFVENTEDEILDAVVEYLLYAENNLFPVSDLQVTAGALMKKQSYSILKKDSILLAKECANNNNEENIEKYRIQSQVEGGSGLISNSYLNNNWLLDSMQVRASS